MKEMSVDISRRGAPGRGQRSPADRQDLIQALRLSLVQRNGQGLLELSHSYHYHFSAKNGLPRVIRGGRALTRGINPLFRNISSAMTNAGAAGSFNSANHACYLSGTGIFYTRFERVDTACQIVK